MIDMCGQLLNWKNFVSFMAIAKQIWWFDLI